MNPILSGSLVYKTHFGTQFFLAPPSNRSASHRITCQKMTCSSAAVSPTLRTVTISYSELKDKNADLSMKIEQGFGPNGLGILSVTDVPGFSSLRQNLLHLAPRLANLPEDVKKDLEDHHSRYVEGLLLCESIVRRAYNRDPFNPNVKDINSISSARTVDCHSLVPGDFMAGKIDC